ncbi:hypothetical protein M770_26600 [Pseudomonas aeruginosa VRFPA03]|nr:hypothetical protein M770_26600 [Pseudomonas aeruginosa VRFPA03]
MGSASQRSVQDLYEDVGDHYRIFIRAPFFQLLKHRDYWVPLLYFFFVLINHQLEFDLRVYLTWKSL